MACVVFSFVYRNVQGKHEIPRLATNLRCYSDLASCHREGKSPQTKHRHWHRRESDREMGMPTPSIRALFTEVWIEYGASMLVILLRFFARWRMFGFEKFDLGDLFAGLAMVCYSLATTGTQSLNSSNRSSIHLKPQESTCLVRHIRPPRNISEN